MREREREREQGKTQREFSCWSKSRVIGKQKMGPAATSLALLCLCSLGLCVPTGTAGASPTQVRTACGFCFFCFFLTETWTENYILV